MSRSRIDENVERTIGSCGIGRADISVAASGPIPSTFRVQDSFELDTHEM